MIQRAVFLLFALIAIPSFASDYGTSGLIDTPTARMAPDGTLTVTAATQSRTNSYAITYQATPRIETTFRYTGYNDYFTYDRNYEAKLKLWSENGFLPQAAIGIRDIVGTGVESAEYFVASKNFGNFDVSLGMGWGRLAGNGAFKNPLSLFSDKFESRPKFNGEIGSLSTYQFFRGEKAGLFGGVSYQLPKMPITAIIEYNPDQYDIDFMRGVARPKSPISSAVRWNPSNGISLTLSHQHKQEWGFELSAALDTISLPAKPKTQLFRSSLDYQVHELPAGINKFNWYDTLLYDVERSGILLIEATVDEKSKSGTIVMGNTSYTVWMDAVSTMVKLADLHLPKIVNTLNIITEEEGHRFHTLSIRRPSKSPGQISQLVEHQVRVKPIKPHGFVQHKTNFVQNKIFFDINLSNRLQLFDPDDPARYQIYAKVDMRLALPNSWLLSGSYGSNITHNFDESRRVSDSALPKVRSDVVKYLAEGDSGLDSFYLEKRGTIYNDVHYRIYGGVLEYMYSGYGSEFLYQPYQSRVGYGLSVNWVWQRDYDKSFGHLDYKTNTAFASIYWASPFYNFDVAVHAGKYLAKDMGSTIEIRRTLHNGWSVGLWATKTNVSAEDFGEGSFDKGMYLKIPLNGLLGTSGRSNYATRIRPIQRDGGQRLEDFSGNIWWDTRAVRYDALSETINRINQ